MTRTLTALFLCLAAAASAAPISIVDRELRGAYLHDGVNAWGLPLDVEFYGDPTTGELSIVKLDVWSFPPNPSVIYSWGSAANISLVDLGYAWVGDVEAADGSVWTIDYHEHGDEGGLMLRLIPRNRPFPRTSDDHYEIWNLTYSVPEPATWQLVLLGLVAWPAGVLLRRWARV